MLRTWYRLVNNTMGKLPTCDLSLMGLSNDPFCSYCKEAVESASHFLCHCSYFAILRTTVWGKPSLHPTDIDSVTVGDIVRFIKKSHRLSSRIQWQLESHRGWLMDPHRGLSLRGDATNGLPLLEPGTQRGRRQLVTGLLRRNCCNGFWLIDSLRER